MNIFRNCVLGLICLLWKRLRPRYFTSCFVAVLVLGFVFVMAGCGSTSKTSTPAPTAPVKTPEISSTNKEYGLGDPLSLFESRLGQGIQANNQYSFNNGAIVVEFKSSEGGKLIASKITIAHNPAVNSQLLAMTKSDANLPAGISFNEGTFKLTNHSFDMEALEPGVTKFMPSDYVVDNEEAKYYHTNDGSVYVSQCTSKKLLENNFDKGQFYVLGKFDKSTSSVHSTIICEGVYKK